MAFKDFQKHCTECKKNRPCGKYHLYVMKLDPTIWEKERFHEVNPDYVDGSPLYYVGKTKHHPRCRQSQHQRYPKPDEKKCPKCEQKILPRKPRLRCDGCKWSKSFKWTCFCGINPGEHEYKSYWESPSKFVIGHTKGFLLTEPREPLPNSAAAEKAERLLAEKLRKYGYGIWAGHHDQRPKKKANKKKNKVVRRAT